MVSLLSGLLFGWWDWVSFNFQMWYHALATGWAYARGHREIIVNAFDLFSFLTVTPELADRLFKSEAITRVLTIFTSLAMFLLYFALYAAVTWVNLQHFRWYWIQVATQIPGLFVVPLLLYWGVTARVSPETMRTIMLWLGAVAFLMSRAFALTVAMIE